MSQQLVLASGNAGKLKEFGEILAPLKFEVLSQKQLGVSDTDEPFDTFVENALRKARHAAACTGLPALADDSGICVNALGGAPGVLSARFAGEPKSDARNNAKLIADLQLHDDWSAYYYCVLVFVRHANDPQPVIADGILPGKIVADPRGENGFGYDPHFWLPEFGCTVAELDPAQKNRISHRGKALQILLEKLK